MKQTFSVPEVSCGHCKSAIEAALAPVEGVSRAEVDITSKQVEVDFDDRVVDRVAVVRAIEASGYAVAG